MGGVTCPVHMARLPFKKLDCRARLYLFYKRCGRHPEHRSDAAVSCPACVREARRAAGGRRRRPQKRPVAEFGEG